MKNCDYNNKLGICSKVCKSECIKIECVHCEIKVN